jgi:acyl-CoA hydrolase
MRTNDTELILASRTVATPADANPNGDIFGGWLLSQMDLAGGTVAPIGPREESSLSR